MGVLNVTPDSFYDGGRYFSLDSALHHAEFMWKSGADIIDIGGESTRPGTPALSLSEEIDRVLPVIQAIKSRIPVKLSVDTYKPDLMQAAVDAGIDMVNDIKGLREEGALEVMARSQVPIVLMHMQNEPATMQIAPHYDDVIRELDEFFAERIATCAKAGISTDRLILDVGFGFGKRPEDNLTLIKHLATFQHFGCPLLLGVSNKTTIGVVLDRPVNERLFGSLALTALAVERGVSFIRTHDVNATRDAILMTQAVLQQD